jgi:hypothetical protein
MNNPKTLIHPGFGRIFWSKKCKSGECNIDKNLQFVPCISGNDWVKMDKNHSLFPIPLPHPNTFSASPTLP